MSNSLDIYRSIYHCLLIDDPLIKASQTRQLYQSVQSASLSFDNEVEVVSMPIPGRPGKPELVAPKKLKPRKIGSEQGQVTLIHSIAHIEFNAINLALDAAYRFRELPTDYYLDWLSVAAEEAKHFQLLSERLSTLGYEYGSFPAHNGLWEMAVRTEHSLLERMALVPRVFEARGLDVTPKIREKFMSINDHETAAILDIIFTEEIGHVEVGNRWYHWACEQEAKEPVETFKELLITYLPNVISGPFEMEARKKAGFSDIELQLLESLSTKRIR